jgi:chromosome segregation protein
MYLSKLELHGFKSFADRTVLEFDAGITSVVGPNGCGKSNIIDAVRWVLGAQRPTLLRSNKMENVIFNGTINRRPLGMAEVELTVENTRNVLPTEYSDVTVGRRLYRSGESEYLLNGVECRLKDIEDLFMDTGMGPDAYSVIELKMVDDILSNTGDSRRTLFEEAAGITKYKHRRKQALRKLENIQEDLTRVRDITSELETQVERLKKQADKAAKHKKYRRKLRRLELQHAQCQYAEMSEQAVELRRSIRTLDDDIQELTTRVDAEEATLEEQRAKLTGREQRLAKRQQTLNEHVDTIRQPESDVRLQKEREETARRGLERLDKQEEEATERRDALDETREELLEKIEDARPRVAAAREALEEAATVRKNAQETVDERRETLQDLREREEHVSEAHASARSEIDRLQNRIDLLGEEQERVREQMEQSKTKTEAFAAERSELQETLEAAVKTVQDRRESLETAEKKSSKKQEALETARENLQQLEREYDALAAEVRLLESLVSSYDEYGDTVKFLAESNWTDHEFQTVADLLGCDENDRLALHTALGPYRSCIVVQTHREAESAIEMLRSQDKGQATFLILDRFNESAPPTRPKRSPEGAQPILEVVRSLKPQFAPVARTLLADVFVTDTLAEAREAADSYSDSDPRTRFVARTGEWVDVTGTIHGGGEAGEETATAHRLGRREQLEHTRKELTTKQDEMNRQSARVDKLEEELTAIPLDNRRTALQEAQAATSEIEQNIERSSYEIRSLEERQEEQQERLEEIEHNLATYKTKLDEKKEAAEQSSQKLRKLRAERETAEEAFQAFMEERYAKLVATVRMITGDRDAAEDLCRNLGVDPRIRPEKLSAAQFVELARRLEAHVPGRGGGATKGAGEP